MKTSDLSIGMEVAVKLGPKSKSCYRAFVVSLDYWISRNGDYQVVGTKPGKFMDEAGIGIAKKENSYHFRDGFKEELNALKDKLIEKSPIRTEKEALLEAKAMLRMWEPNIVRPALIASSWADYMDKEGALTDARIEKLKQEEAIDEARHARRQKLEGRLGIEIFLLSRAESREDDRCSIKLSDLEKITDHMDALSNRLNEELV